MNGIFRIGPDNPLDCGVNIIYLDLDKNEKQFDEVSNFLEHQSKRAES